MIKNLEFLYDEAIKDSIDGIKKLLENNKYLNNARNEEGNSLLFFATYDNNINIAKYLIENGAYPLQYNKNLTCPISLACTLENCELLNYMLDICQPAILDYDLELLLATAAVKGKYNNLHCILKRGYDCNVDYNQDPILHWAVASGNVNIVKLLLEYGALINKCDEENRTTALYKASAEGYLDIVKTLLDNGADIDLPSRYGTTPLIIASCNDNTEIVECLLINHADIEKKNNNGCTALLKSLEFGNIQIIKVLLEHGADLNAKDKKGRGFEYYCKKLKKPIKSQVRDLIYK